MGTPGVKLNISKAEIAEVIKKSDGYAIACMEMLNCRNEWFYEKLKEFPELKQLLDEERQNKKGKLVRKSQDLLEWTLDHKEEMPSLAQKSAIYILDNQAGDFGYNKPQSKEQTQVSDHVMEKFSAVMNQLSSLQERNIADNNIINDEKS